MAISFDKAFGVHDDALTLRSERATILANNIANADTPGYKARDIDFQQVLKMCKIYSTLQPHSLVKAPLSSLIIHFLNISNKSANPYPLCRIN